jgi:hypothetical protein
MEHTQETRAQLLTPKQAAARYGFGVSTMAKWRIEGGGPAYLKVRRSVYYTPEDIAAWLDSKRVISTSQAA